MEDSEALAQLARKYLDLWIEHWAASLAAPETAGSLARLTSGFAPWLVPARDADEPGSGKCAPDEPAAVCTAPDIGDDRADQLESRIAALERRLAELEAQSQPDVSDAAGQPRRRIRKVRAAGD